MKTTNSPFSKIKSAKIIVFLCFLIPFQLFGQSWPVTTENRTRKITVFKPSVESYQSNTIDFRAAIAITEKNETTPTFGSIWGSGKLKNSGANSANLWGVIIDDIRFPDGITDEQINELAGEIEDAINARQPLMLLDEIKNDQLYAEQEKQQAEKINNNPPKIYYASESTILVNIDGEPIVQNTDISGIDMVVNTPFLILRFSNNYYLGNGSNWYKSSRATGDYKPEKNVPNAVINAANSLKSSNEEGIADFADEFYPKVIVSTEPAELVQTDGSPEFSPIQGTSLLFVSNTEEHLLLDISRQAYFVLLSGRWFTATKLDGTWKYVSPDKVPSEFAKIPEGTEKDAVLASVYGTRAANEAVRNSMIPQAAMVDRNTATSSVYYDGNPEFEPIQNTNLQMAVNSSNTVIVERNRYFLVDNGVWFQANSPNGPWYVSDYRPAQVVMIAPTCPAYNLKYVEIYYHTPTVVYVGYTSGYLSSYISHNVIVYGTGHRYKPWRGRYYYPRPCTWGYGMTYNPWYGWTLSMTYGIGGYGWFAYSHHYHYYPRGYYCRHGWWGPHVYRPPYRAPYSHYYGHRPAHYRPIHYCRNVNQRPVVYSRPTTTNIYRTQERTGVTATRQTASSSRQTSSRDNYNYSHSARPTATSTRASASQGNTTRPDTSTRPVTGTTTTETTNQTTRPGSTTTSTGTRPSGTTTGTTTSTGTRPGGTTTGTTTSTGTRPGATTGTVQTTPSTRPEATTQTGTRPGSSTGTTTQTTPTTRPDVTPQTNRPGTTTTQTGSRPNTNTGTTTETRPSTRPNGITQPATNPGSSTETRPSTRPQPSTPSTNSSGSQTSNQQTGSRGSSQQTTQSSQPTVSRPTQSSQPSVGSSNNSGSNRQQPNSSGSSSSGGSGSSNRNQQSNSNSGNRR